MPSGEQSVDAFEVAGPALAPLLAFELGAGNSIAEVCAESGSVVLARPLDLDGAKSKLGALLKGYNAFEKGAAYVHGKIVPIGEAKISLTDWGYRRSDVTYDVVSVFDGYFFRLDDHIKRFRRSMDGLRMKPAETDEQIAEILHRLVRLTGFRSAYVAMDCLRGSPPAGAPRHPKYAQPHFGAFVVPFAWVVAKDIFETRGTHIVVSSVPRIPDACVDPTIKNFHWGDLTKAAFEADDAGADNAVLVDYEGKYLTEGPGFNVFIVSDGKVLTPERGCLMGVTRQSVLDLCAELGVPFEVTHVPKELIHTADEVFICTTAGGIMGVGRVDGKPVAGRDGPGPLSEKLRQLFWKKRSEGWLGTPVKY
ncbi:aminotransferase, class IV [Hyaloraphidium curvatum]|nr:aminotransferase, class IV [Hyaloraphidium curvatum]